MSLLIAHQKFLESGRPRGTGLHFVDPTRALTQLVEFVDHGGTLASLHPWELHPGVARALEDRFGHTPPGGWARLAGLAAGADILHARAEAFVPVADAAWIRDQPLGCRPRMVEAFTARLIPPAAAAALYVSLDVHPLWGLELGRDVGACKSPPGAATAGARTALPLVRDLVFGTITGLVTALRCADPDAKYPSEVLGDVLWWSAVCARRSIAGCATKHGALPIFLDGSHDDRRLLTTRLAITDLLDFVFVPAGVARRDDSGWFTVDRDALVAVRVGDWDLERQVGWWNEALVLEHREAC